MAISNNEFRAALARFASGVTVVTLKDSEGKMHGITVSAFSAVSLNPPLVLVCINNYTASHSAFHEGKRFVVNILHEEQADYSVQFASQIRDKFINILHHEGLEGIPVLKDALVNLECRLVEHFIAGDHTIFIGEVEQTYVKEGNPLVYYLGDYRKLVVE